MESICYGAKHLSGDFRLGSDSETDAGLIEESPSWGKTGLQCQKYSVNPVHVIHNIVLIQLCVLHYLDMQVYIKFIWHNAVRLSWYHEPQLQYT